MDKLRCVSAATSFFVDKYLSHTIIGKMINEFIHELNKESVKLNKMITNPTQQMQPVAIDKSIYQPKQPAPQQAAAPQQAHAPVPPPPVPPPAPAVAPVSEEVVKSIEECTNNLKDVNKKLERMFNLIERRVVKNAKEVTIRIKLKDDETDNS